MKEQDSNELYQSIGARIRIVDVGQLDILVFLDTYNKNTFGAEQNCK